MALQQQIKDELKQAMKDKDKLRLRVLRDMTSGFTNKLLEEGEKPSGDLSDESALEVIQKLAKQRKDSIEQFEKGGREDLADEEKKELEILEEYLPEKMSDEEIEKVVKEKADELGIEDKSGFGQLMGAVMGEVGARADGDDVKRIVNNVLEE